MKNLFITLSALLFIILSCKKETNNENTFLLIDTINLKNDECYFISNYKICFDSVTYDSRCPINALCVWEGNATVKFKILKNNEKIIFNLNTSINYTNDTIIDELFIRLNQLFPYPKIPVSIEQKDYIATLTIANVKDLRANAVVLSFNPEKCSCCWGWTIKFDNDTIKSASYILEKHIGYNIINPTKVYIEIGNLSYSCDKYNYYEINQLIKIKK